MEYYCANMCDVILEAPKVMVGIILWKVGYLYPTYLRSDYHTKNDECTLRIRYSADCRGFCRERYLIQLKGKIRCKGLHILPRPLKTWILSTYYHIFLWQKLWESVHKSNFLFSFAIWFTAMASSGKKATRHRFV